MAPKGRGTIWCCGLRVALPGLLNNHYKSINHSVQPRWGGTPAHCDASRISAGVQFGSFAAAGPNNAKHFQNLPLTCSKGPKPFQIPPQTPPKPTPKLPKVT